MLNTRNAKQHTIQMRIIFIYPKLSQWGLVIFPQLLFYYTVLPAGIFDNYQEVVQRR